MSAKFSIQKVGQMRRNIKLIRLYFLQLAALLFITSSLRHMPRLSHMHYFFTATISSQDFAVQSALFDPAGQKTSTTTSTVDSCQSTQKVSTNSQYTWCYADGIIVPEWWYAVFNVIAIALGCAAVAGYPTYTNVGVVFFGLALAIIVIVPTGIIKATTGIEVEYKCVEVGKSHPVCFQLTIVPSNSVLAEFIGGAWTPGNALAMNFFKCFG